MGKKEKRGGGKWGLCNADGGRKTDRSDGVMLTAAGTHGDKPELPRFCNDP